MDGSQDDIFKWLDLVYSKSNEENNNSFINNDLDYEKEEKNK